MGQYHIVRQGEYLARIARQHGFADQAAVWEHAQNAPLRETRPSPDVLLAGDRVYIPDPAPRAEQRATEQRHRFTVAAPRPMLRLALEGPLGRPLRGAECELRIEGAPPAALVANAHGIVEHPIPLALEKADLAVRTAEPPAERVVRVLVGQLDPASEVAGQEARLANLGYRPGAAGDPAAYDFRSAVEEFQCDHGLAVDGKCGPATQKKLVAVHGS